MAVRRGRYINPISSGFFDSITRELIDVAGQEIILYQTSYEESFVSDQNKLYREATRKKRLKPVRVPCLVMFEDKTLENISEAFFEYENNMSAFIHRNTLKTLDLNIAADDLVSFQGLFYEVYDVNDSEMYHGSPHYKHSVKIFCKTKRLTKDEENLITDLEDDKDRNIQ